MESSHLEYLEMGGYLMINRRTTRRTVLCQMAGFGFPVLNLHVLLPESWLVGT